MKLRAFPSEVDAGMELRDWFAGMALQGYIASTPEGETYIVELAAKEAYDLADAMMKAREGDHD